MPAQSHPAPLSADPRIATDMAFARLRARVDQLCETSSHVPDRLFERAMFICCALEQADAQSAQGNYQHQATLIDLATAEANRALTEFRKVGAQ